MKAIYKYKIGSALFGDNIIEITIPKNAELLSVEKQYDDINAWYLIDINEIETRKDRYYQIGTGHKYDDYKGKFVNTIIANPYVWHIFVEKNI